MLVVDLSHAAVSLSIERPSIDNKMTFELFNVVLI